MVVHSHRNIIFSHLGLLCSEPGNDACRVDQVPIADLHPTLVRALRNQIARHFHDLVGACVQCAHENIHTSLVNDLSLITGSIRSGDFGISGSLLLSNVSQMSHQSGTTQQKPRFAGTLAVICLSALRLSGWAVSRLARTLLLHLDLGKTAFVRHF